MTSTFGYIASSVTSDRFYCDGRTHPWVIAGQPGQRVNLTLYDFALPPPGESAAGGGYETARAGSAGSAGAGGRRTVSDDEEDDDYGGERDVDDRGVVSTSFCREYGVIEDSGLDRTTVICGSGHGERVKRLYESEGNVVKIWITGGLAPNDFKRFLIKFEGSASFSARLGKKKYVSHFIAIGAIRRIFFILLLYKCIVFH